MTTPPNHFSRPVRILVADDQVLLSERMVIFLNEKGFETRYIKSGLAIGPILEQWMPDFIIYDLMLPDLNGIEFMRQLKQANLLGPDKIKVFVTSGHSMHANIKESLRMGAADYLVKPIRHDDLFTRLILHLQAKREIIESRESAGEVQSAQYYLHLTDLLLQESLKAHAHQDDLLYNLAKMVALSTNAVRVSLIRCDTDARTGWVHASSDNRDIDRRQIDLFKYPEILYVLRHEKLLALDNIANDPTMHFVTQQNKEISFSSMIVAPVKIGGIYWGVLSIRMAASKAHVHEFEMRYAQLAAHVLGLQILDEPVYLKKAQ